MEQPAAIPMIVMTRHQDHVETINKTLRNAGHPVHPSWLPEAGDLGDALTQISPEMLIIFADEGIVDLAAAMDFRKRLAPEVPVLVVHEEVDEDKIAAALALGAKDAVTLANLDRLRHVVDRELEARRLDKTLSATMSAAREYERQLNDFMHGSADAIAQVQEGIIVEANPAWMELFGHAHEDPITGTPLMDEFEPESHAALKGALVACLHGKWAGHALRAVTELPDGSSMLGGPQPGARRAGRRTLRARLGHGRQPRPTPAGGASHGCHAARPATGFLHRKYFIDELHQRLANPPRAGVRHLAYIEPDKYDAILGEAGILVGEDFLVEFAQRLNDLLQPEDLAGRFGGNGFMVLLQRGNAGDVEAWAEHVVHKIGEHVFQVGRPLDLQHLHRRPRARPAVADRSGRTGRRRLPRKPARP